MSGLKICILCMWLAVPALASNLPLKLQGHGGPIKAVTISLDGKRALTASFDYSIIYWDLTAPEGTILQRLIGHDAAVNDVAFLSEDKQAVSVSDDGSLALWDLQSGEMLTRIQAEVFKVLDVAVSADGKRIATARWDATARVYDIATLKELSVFDGHRGNVNAVVFSDDGSKVYSASYDGQIIEWDAATGGNPRPLYRHGWGINSLARLNANQLLFGAIDGSFGIVDVKQAEKIADLAKRERPIQSVKVSKDGRLMGFGDGAGRIEVYQTSDRSKLEGAEVAYGPVWDFDFVPNTNQVYHVGLDDFAIRWQVAPFKLSKIESSFPRRFQARNSDDAGAQEFQRKCSVCHTLTPDDANRAGPTLHGVFGRRAGTLPGYKYSAALENADIVWDEKTIAQLFDDGPDVMVPGTKMPIQRLKSVSRRDDLIRYLKAATAPNK